MVLSETVSGNIIDLLDPDPNKIDIWDIAISLCRECRWSGQTEEPYTVAAHCMQGAWELESEGANVATQMAFLLHDASEAYIGDIPSPLKTFLGEPIRSLENKLLEKINAKFIRNIGTVDWAQVETMDSRMGRYERETFMLSRKYKHNDAPHNLRFKLLTGYIEPAHFVREFNSLKSLQNLVL